MLYSGKDLRKLIIPLIIEQILAIAVGMADTIMVSAAGEAAVSGVSLVDTVNILLINVFSALATGGAVVSGHFLGKKKREDACKSAWQILLFATLLAFVISVIFITAHDPLLRLMFGKIEDDVMKASKTYLIITTYSFVALAIYNSCAALFRADERIKGDDVGILADECNQCGRQCDLHLWFAHGRSRRCDPDYHFQICSGSCDFFVDVPNQKRNQPLRADYLEV